VAVCAAHHRHGLHGGTIRAGGSVPGDVHWELGVRSGAAPLLTYLGDQPGESPVWPAAAASRREVSAGW